MVRLRRIRGLGFIVWKGRHEMYHVLIGLVWAWFLREIWGQFNMRWIFFSVFGSLLPDLEHLIYFFTYGKTDPYSLAVKNFLKNRQWRMLTVHMASGHKQNTNLALHNFYFMFFLLGLSLLSSIIEWRLGVILFGAMVLHYLFDVVDDFLILGTVNENWRRLRRKK